MAIAKRATAAAPASVVSLNPESFVHGGGLLDDADVEVTAAQFVMFDYNGTKDAVPALGLTLVDADGKETDQYFTCGKATDFVPSGDGMSLIPVGQKTSLNDSSNLGQLLLSLLNAGFPSDKLSDQASFLIGLNAHVNRVVVQKAKGANDKDREALLVTKINRMPWEPKGAVGAKPAARPAIAGKANGAAKPGPVAVATSAAPAAGDDGLTEVVTEVLIGALAENGGQLAKKDIATAVFKAIGKDHPNFAQRAKIVSLAFSDAFLSTAEGITYDGATVSMG